MAALDDADMPLTTRAALVRTRLAFERTLMAWVRTAVSLITFGFTLFKAFQWAGQHAPVVALVGILVALAFIVIGVLALLTVIRES